MKNLKITIEGEPKEIAAFEQALKDGNVQQIFNTYNSPALPAEVAKQLHKSAGDMILRHR